ncbi:hypothetical protein Tsp_06201 [Trichinella spiralis]|uniref:hypothetical protein n=1 Tax=Trichinella spiralis TaxID=6334 RepID=UPI0001EFBC27|nr:hypothetical protein Tsp_06201 [Trichinella spiralis]
MLCRFKGFILARSLSCLSNQKKQIQIGMNCKESCNTGMKTLRPAKECISPVACLLFLLHRISLSRHLRNLSHQLPLGGDLKNITTNACCSNLQNQNLSPTEASELYMESKQTSRLRLKVEKIVVCSTCGIAATVGLVYQKMYANFYSTAMRTHLHLYEREYKNYVKASKAFLLTINDVYLC